MMPWIFKRDSDSSRIMKLYRHTWEEKEFTKFAPAWL